MTNPTFGTLQDKYVSGDLSIISTSCWVPGKHMGLLDKDYLLAYDSCDVCLLKGQANFQTIPIGFHAWGRFRPLFYRKPLWFLFGARSQMTNWCLNKLFGEKPGYFQDQCLLIDYDAFNPITYPRKRIFH